jgi:hypothetical protein
MFSTLESKKYLYFQDTTSKEKALEATRYHLHGLQASLFVLF